MPVNVPLQELHEGVLYHLREKHPVIDAVGLLRDSEKELWLVLIQISMSTYQTHRSKAQNVKDFVNGAEKATCICNIQHTLLSYYEKLVLGVSFKSLYVYVSPKQLLQSGENPSSLLQDTGIYSRTKDLYLGLIPKTFIDAIVAKL